MNMLGECYYYGHGTPIDYEEAIQWYQIAAENGSSKAMNSLGECYFDGTDVQKNYSEAFYWYSKGAEEGNATAQDNLGYCYSKGIGTAPDPWQAFAWRLKAAKQGDAMAQFNVGVAYHNGSGVDWDPGQALSWYKKSAYQGNVQAQEAYNLLLADLSLTPFRSFLQEEVFRSLREGNNYPDLGKIIFESSKQALWRNGEVISEVLDTPRRIIIEQESFDKHGYAVSIENPQGIHPLWGNNLQMSPKRMEVIKVSKDGSRTSTILRGYGYDAMGMSFSDYGLEVIYQNDSIDQIILSMYDRDKHVIYIK